MIEIPGRIRVLRYREEEIYRMKPSDVKPFHDWFSAKIENENPKWRILTSLHDFAAEYIYVILYKQEFSVKQTTKKKNRMIWIEEEVIKH